MENLLVDILKHVQDGASFKKLHPDLVQPRSPNAYRSIANFYDRGPQSKIEAKAPFEATAVLVDTIKLVKNKYHSYKYSLPTECSLFDKDGTLLETVPMFSLNRIWFDGFDFDKITFTDEEDTTIPMCQFIRTGFSALCDADPTSQFSYFYTDSEIVAINPVPVFYGAKCPNQSTGLEPMLEVVNPLSTSMKHIAIAERVGMRAVYNTPVFFPPTYKHATIRDLLGYTKMLSLRAVRWQMKYGQRYAPHYNFDWYNRHKDVHMSRWTRGFVAIKRAFTDPGRYWQSQYRISSWSETCEYLYQKIMRELSVCRCQEVAWFTESDNICIDPFTAKRDAICKTVVHTCKDKSCKIFRDCRGCPDQYNRSK